MTAPHLQNTKWFEVAIDGLTHRVHPIDGELIGQGPGLNHGWVHMIAYDCRVVGFCGIAWFDENAVLLDPPTNLTLTLDAYEVANLRWLLCLSRWANNGDWFHQILNQLEAYDCGDTGPNG